MLVAEFLLVIRYYRLFVEFRLGGKHSGLFVKF